MRNHIRTSIKLTTIILCLSGCLGQPELVNKMQDYADRLERVTDIPTELPAPILELDYPSSDQRKVNIPSTSLNLREFYAINGCALATKIAQRNTTLGKVEAPELRYLYERDLLHTLKECGELIESENKDLTAELNRLLTIKTEQLPAVYAQMIKNSQAMVSGLSFAQDFIGSQQTTTEITQSIAAINFLSKLPDNSLWQESELSSHMQTLERDRVWARTWRTQSYLHQTLPTLTRTLERFTAQVSCQRAEEDLKILRNVMLMFFIDYIQPVASNINYLQQSSHASWQEILSNNNLSDEYVGFIKQQTAERYEMYTSTLSAHVTAWQTLFDKCAMSPI